MNYSNRSLWLLGLSTFGTVCVIGIFNYKFNQWMRKRVNKIKKDNQIDILNKNRLLTFGVSSDQCDGHMKRQFDCGNLDCNYGRLSYILGFINNCQKNLDVCIYIITAKLFGDCIINAHRRGVKVRVIADSDMSFSAQSLINTFRAGDIPTRQRMSPFIMHHKFVIVDSEVLINGSMNFTMTGAFCNWENVMITTQPELVNSFQKAFNSLWEDFSPLNYSPLDGIIKAQAPQHQVANV
ncbi:unnamed protein product [Nezara viridula]|uniref:Mitochondrial cardiolipin hydrolase n=1 Tax=Nezara viridula TaxID=85310 RepID=A0A9P0HF58_NEZVI|nr:unnamed protein product [Nezara viridula]